MRRGEPGEAGIRVLPIVQRLRVRGTDQRYVQLLRLCGTSIGHPPAQRHRTTHPPASKAAAQCAAAEGPSAAGKQPDARCLAATAGQSSQGRPTRCPTPSGPRPQAQQGHAQGVRPRKSQAAPGRRHDARRLAAAAASFAGHPPAQPAEPNLSLKQPQPQGSWIGVIALLAQQAVSGAGGRLTRKPGACRICASLRPPSSALQAQTCIQPLHKRSCNSGRAASQDPQQPQAGGPVRGVWLQRCRTLICRPLPSSHQA